jgi:hypothetical protein
MSIVFFVSSMVDNITSSVQFLYIRNINANFRSIRLEVLIKIRVL